MSSPWGQVCSAMNEGRVVVVVDELSSTFFLMWGLCISFPGGSHYRRSSGNRVRRHRFKRNRGNKSRPDWTEDEPPSHAISLVCVLHIAPVSVKKTQDVRDSIPVFKQKRHDIYQLHEVKRANTNPNPKPSTEL